MNGRSLRIHRDSGRFVADFAFFKQTQIARSTKVRRRGFQKFSPIITPKCWCFDDGDGPEPVLDIDETEIIIPAFNFHAILYTSSAAARATISPLVRSPTAMTFVRSCCDQWIVTSILNTPNSRHSS